MMTSSLEEIEGNVSHIVFRSEETGYTVCSITDKGEEFTLVGSFSHISVSEKIKAKGRWKEHPVYGKQFSVEEYQLEVPDSLFGIEQYLASGAIKGIGKAIAARIVKKFKEDSLRIMEEEPERLAEIHGISMQKAMDIATNLSGQREQQDIFLLLQGYGISLNLSYKIYQHFQGETLRVLQENPYRIAEELEGVGFKKCDELAKKVEEGSADDYENWLFGNIAAERAYMNLIAAGRKPQEARVILPLDTNTELVHTTFVSDWKHFFDLRALGTTGAPHPDAKVLARPLYDEFCRLGLIEA